ncbi:MAG: cellulase family glycosylhydrolase [Ruminococcus sp.]|nr:cellulase family glycosylhydrolase [Ruminococcus sp.]
MFEKTSTIKRIVSVSAAAMCLLSSLRIAPETEFTAFAVTNMSAFEITEDMQIGWNLGNTLDAYNTTSTGLNTEKCWGNPETTKAMIDAVKAKGFNTVRIPTTWFNHLDGSNNIDSAWLARVKTVVDYAIDNDMYVILNLHHEEWVDRADLGTAYDEMKPKFIKIWTQINEQFKDYDQHLIFESMNEPRAKGTTHEWWGPQQNEVDTINNLNADFVKLIRSSDSPYAKNRLLMIPGYCASSDSTIYSKIVVPDDDFVAVSIHAYSPYDFTMNAEVSDHSTFTEKYSTDLSTILEGIRKTFIANDIPVVIGEFGTSNFNNTEARVQWADEYISTTKAYGIPCVLWDNNVISSSQSPGECHGYLDRNSLTWYTASEPVVDKMMSVLADDSIKWGGTKNGVQYDHEDISKGNILSNTSAKLDASVEEGNCSAPADVTWAQLEGGDVAVKFTGDEPVIAFTDGSWKNWTEVKPYDVKDGIAYYSAKHIQQAWTADTDIAHIFVRTNGVTTVQTVAVIGGAEVSDAPEDKTIKYNIDLSGANMNGTLVIDFEGTPGAFNNGCVGYANGSEWEKIEWEGTFDGSGKLQIKVPMSEFKVTPSGAEVQVWWHDGDIAMKKYEVTGSSSVVTTTTTTSGGNNTTTTTTTTADPQPNGKGFYVDGQTIRDANGQEFIMRGVNIAHAWYKDKTEQSIKAAAAKGTNVVRIVCADGGQWTKTSADELKKIIGWCKENEQVCILEVHDATGSNNIDDVVKAAEYWTEMKDILNENRAYVILNIANEWYGEWNSATWAEGSEKAIKVIRDAGIKNMIMIDSAGWGQYPKSIGEKGAEVFASDPDKNTVFSAHLYEYAGGTAQMVKDNIDTALKCGAPVVIGEFGYKHTDGDVDEATIMSYCAEKNMGYLAWSWKGNSGGVEYLDLTNDWDGTDLTEWGQIYFGEISGKAKKASVFSGSTPDDKYLAGDADCDGFVKMNDAVLIMQSISNGDKYGLGQPDGITEQGSKNADCDGKSGVTPNDALTIQKYLLKIVTALPVK